MYVYLLVIYKVLWLQKFYNTYIPIFVVKRNNDKLLNTVFIKKNIFFVYFFVVGLLI